MAKAFYVDEEECIGCGACVDCSPDVFHLNDDNIAEITNADGASEEEIQDAIESCPTECIHWEDEG
ncbi:MAG TPA: ferredoxin [Spirochaetes bacterium]|nr:ferredoxin [Spirochaetota bacterium]